MVWSHGPVTGPGIEPLRERQCYHLDGPLHVDWVGAAYKGDLGLEAGEGLLSLGRLLPE